MKTQLLRVSVLAVAVSSLWLCAGCQEGIAQTDVPVVGPLPEADAVELPAPAPKPEGTNAPPQPPATKVVQAPIPPDDVKASPALAEVIKLVQAGVGEEVILSYITNSSLPFKLSSDQIVYLNDLGVSATVLTSLIHHDPAPAEGAEKPGVAAPLPPGFALTTPAANVYPGKSAPLAPPAPQVGVDPNATNSYAEALPVEVEQPAAAPDFYDSLAPYGSWIEVQGYGRCWQPTVAVVSPSWRPYCDRGRWLWTDCGWYWYSDYSWGWAPFHYGRWCTYPSLGWFWVPDTCWGPSWVSWRYTSSHCGWAPLPPAAHFVSGAGFYHNGVYLGFQCGDFGLSASLFTFVPFGHFHDRTFYNHCVSGSQATVIYNHSTVVNNYIVTRNGRVNNHGIGIDPVARASGHKISTVSIQPASPAVVGNRIRREQLQNNGLALRVVEPQAASITRPARSSTPAQPGLRAEPVAGSRSISSPRALSSTPRPLTSTPPALGSTPTTTPNATRADVPVVKARQEEPALRSQQTTRNTVTAPSTTHWMPQPGGTVVSTRTEKPDSHSTLVPPASQRPSPAQPAQPGRTPKVTPAPSTVDSYRVYAEPAVVSKPANPRVDGAAPQLGHPGSVYASPTAPMFGRPQYTPSPGPAVIPSYRSEAGRSPVMRPDSGRAPAPSPSVAPAPRAAPAAPAAPRAAPAQSSSGTSSKSGSTK